MVQVFILMLCLGDIGCKPINGHSTVAGCDAARKKWLIDERVHAADLNRHDMRLFCQPEPKPTQAKLGSAGADAVAGSGSPFPAKARNSVGPEPEGLPTLDLSQYGTAETCPIVLYESFLFRAPRYLELGCPSMSDFWKKVETRLKSP
jgi:hypothetical protein